jgi:hypothetical protein
MIMILKLRKGTLAAAYVCNTCEHTVHAQT